MQLTKLTRCFLEHHHQMNFWINSSGTSTDKTLVLLLIKSQLEEIQSTLYRFLDNFMPI